VPRIALEISANLVPDGEGQEWANFQAAIGWSAVWAAQMCSKSSARSAKNEMKRSIDGLGNWVSDLERIQQDHTSLSRRSHQSDASTDGWGSHAVLSCSSWPVSPRNPGTVLLPRL